VIKVTSVHTSACPNILERKKIHTAVKTVSVVLSPPTIIQADLLQKKMVSCMYPALDSTAQAHLSYVTPCKVT
jgi:hypothetical protein